MNTKEFDMDFKIMFGDKPILTVKSTKSSYELEILRDDVLHIPYMEHLRLCIEQIAKVLKTLRTPTITPREYAYIEMLTQSKTSLSKNLNKHKRYQRAFVCISARVA